MFVDASALCAMIANESGSGDLQERLLQSPRGITSPLAVWETTIAAGRLLGIDLDRAEAVVLEFLSVTGIEILAVPASATASAVSAHRKFGKGRHPAALNFGDCFAYACAKHHKMPLLFKGNDFAFTDVEAA